MKSTFLLYKDRKMVLIMPEGTFHDEVLFMMVVRPIRCCLGIAIGARAFVDVHRNGRLRLMSRSGHIARKSCVARERRLRLTARSGRLRRRLSQSVPLRVLAAEP